MTWFEVNTGWLVLFGLGVLTLVIWLGILGADLKSLQERISEVRNNLDYHRRSAEAHDLPTHVVTYFGSQRMGDVARRTELEALAAELGYVRGKPAVTPVWTKQKKSKKGQRGKKEHGL